MKRFWKMMLASMVMLSILFAMFPNQSYGAKPKEFRAVWVSSVYGIDYPKQATADATCLMTQADEILDGAKSLGMTAIILQVRPAADSLYPSNIFPWSKYLTGRQGLAPNDNFDPLSYWISEAHERGLELHAWVNPFRVANSDIEFEQMLEHHPAKQNPNWVIRHTDGKYYFNPGIPEVRQLVIRAAEEIVQGYEVDGLHLDDYFYPGTDFADEESYQQYGSAFVEIGDWRRNNIDRLVSELYDMTKRVGREVSFGVSPSGIWANTSSIVSGSDTNGNQSYFSSYADSRKWVQNGWVDYICPQLYWNIGHPLADYETLVKWWAQLVRGTGVKLYIGMADYQTGSENPESVWHGIGAITKEIELNREIPEIVGEVHFSYSSIGNSPALKAYYRDIYHNSEFAENPAKLDKRNHNAYILGDSGNFYPEQSLSRAQTASILARLAVDENGESLFDEKTSYPVFYTDIAQDVWYAPAVGFVSERKIMQGYENGDFCPHRAITRAEFAMLIFRLESGSEEGVPEFTDISAGHWAADAVAFAQKCGYLSGYGDGSFRPDKSITRAETVKIMNRMLERKADVEYLAQVNNDEDIFFDVSKNHWAYYEIAEASLSHQYERNGELEQWTEIKK